MVPGMTAAGTPSPYPVGSANNPIPVNASKLPKGTVIGAPTKAPKKPAINKPLKKAPMKSAPKKSKKAPTYQQVQKSIRKTMGYA